MFLFNGCTYTLCEYGTGWSGGDTGGVTLYKLQYNVCIDTWSLRHLTSAEEYPDEEYLDMSKSSSLKGSQREKMRVWKGEWYICTAQCSTFIKSLMNIYRLQSDRDSKNSLNLHFPWCNSQALDNPDGIIRVIFLRLEKPPPLFIIAFTGWMQLLGTSGLVTDVEISLRKQLRADSGRS